MSITATLIHIANEQALIAWLAENVPGVIAEDGARVAGGMARTASYPNPGQANDGPAGLYANLTSAQVAQWTALAADPALGITILGQMPYQGLGTGAALYATVEADGATWPLWESVATIPARRVTGEAEEVIELPARVARPSVA
ncbi:hypothetical protein PSM7751_03695 [Pseudooceanicola marinus]|uniref:Uncharacterized protein n=1 Tax=Pseudooceanicola marinus TaxID=396013 RepID=A0A1X7A4T0_9RHOB|nr:hypothetical protein [Pseudooceanicola marinus]PJE27129.1 hypothetical protein CVM50_17085 [Pseudooceanicola marinus]SLN70159.1 hypothetical protein PSM7751_03695 [Pseudooceanicola marinus]